MDIELTSIAALLLTNGMIVFCIMIFLLFFYKWDSAKTYDDLAENVNDYGGPTNELFLGEGAS
jgi:hypothetical protein